jgi:excisionase family DNA binding protein
MPEGRVVLRPADLVPILGLSRSRIYELIGLGVIPAVRVGGAIRIPRSALEEWLREQSKRALAVSRDPESASGSR